MYAESIPLEIPVQIKNAPNCISHSQKLERALDMIMHNSDEELLRGDADEGLPQAYLSTTYYKNKNYFIENNSLSKEDKVLLPFSGLQFGGDNDQISRDNSYLNFAFNIKTSYELPVDKLEQIEQRQIIDSFLDKKGKTHASHNFNKLQKIYGSKVTANVHNFSKISYTHDIPKHIANITGGILPSRIQNVAKTDPANKFFNRDVYINCTSKWRFEQLEILVSRSDQMEIVNKNTKTSIKINDVLSSSPELEVYYESKVTFPYSLKAGETLTMQLVLTPETYGQFEAVVFILFEHYVFIEPVSGYVSENVYHLEPTYVTDVLANESLSFSLDVFNYKPNEDLVIRNLYPSVDYFQSYWPNGVKVEDKLDFDKLNDTFVSQFLKVAPQGTKDIMTFTFQVSEPGDYQTAIVMITSFGDFMQIPFYFHVHNDPIKFYPTIVDFGSIAKNFDLVRIALKFKVKQNYDHFIVQDIFVPIDDDRLDFLFTDAKKLNQEKKPLKDLTPLGNVILNPIHDGMVDSKIIIILSGPPNITLRIEIPIIGFVSNDSLVMTGNQTQIKRTQSTEEGIKSREQPSPLALFDVSPHVLNDSSNQVLFKIPLYYQKTLYSAFYFTNNYKFPIYLRDVLNFNPELTIDIVTDLQNKLSNSNEGLMLSPAQSIRLGWIELRTDLLKISQGTKFVQIQVNDTLIPLSVAIYDRNLLCVWEEDYSQIRFTQCKQGYEIAFGSIATNEPKYRKVNITNLNPMEITIETIEKPQDDLIIFVEKVYYKSKKVAEYSLEGDNSTSPSFMLYGLNKKKTNKFKIGKYETYTLVFMVKSKEVKHVPDGTVRFLTSGVENYDFSFTYSYLIIEGQLTLMPYQLYYDPAFPGILQHKTITAKSTFEVPIMIKQIICSDPRIQPRLMNSVIMPKNKSELAVLTFDPSKTSLSAISPQQFLQGNQLPQTVAQIDIQQLFAAHSMGAAPQMTPQVFNLINGAHVIIQNNQGNQFQANGPNLMGQSNMGGLQNMMKQPLNYGEIFQWREKQKSWEKLGSLGKTEIQAKVTIETNIFQNIEIPVKAYLSRPQIVVNPDDDVLNFDLVQIGTHVMKNIKIYNPSDEPLIVQLYLANEEYFQIEAQINEQAEKQSDYEKDFYRQMHQGGNSKEGKGAKKAVTGNDDETNEQLEESYISMYCAAKLKDAYLDEPLTSKELLVNAKEDVVSLCQQLLTIAGKRSKAGIQLNQDLQKNLEPFFKELYQSKYGGEGGTLKNGDQINLSSFFQSNGQQSFIGTYMNQQLQTELKSQVDQITALTSATPMDTVLKGLQKNSQRSFFDYSGLLEQVRQIMKLIFYENYPGASQPVSPFRLKNEYLQDLIMNNGSTYSPLLQDYAPNSQSFFINPKVQGKLYTVDPKRNYTISDAVMFYPQSIKQQQSQMTLLIRNNLTILYPIELRGSGGTGIIEFIKVIKKASNETNSDLLMNEKFNTSHVLNTSSPEVREKIISFIYGGADQETEPKSKQQDFILFSISIEDLLHFDQEVQHEIFANYDSQQLSQLDLLLSDKSHQIRVNNYHKRILIAKNTGNMPVSINNILVEGKKCQSNGLVVENCHAFNLLPGETHQIHLSYVTDFSLAKIKKTLSLESQYFTMEYVVQVQIPIRFLSLAHQMVPLNQLEEQLYYSMTIAIIVVGGVILLFGFKGLAAHMKYSKEQFEHNQKQAILDSIKDKKKGETKSFVKKGGLNLPVIKDLIGSEQIATQYQFVMEKFENQNSLLLKEISNICGKKNMVILEAQKQALDAEQERKKQNRMNLQKYFEKKNKEDSKEQVNSFQPMVEKQKASQAKEEEKPMVLEQSSRSNTMDSAAASLDLSRENIGKHSEEKNDEGANRGGKQQQKKKNQARQNKKQVQRREEILKQQELQNEREKQLQIQREVEEHQKALLNREMELSKIGESQVSVLEIEEVEGDYSLDKREQPCNEQVGIYDQKGLDEQSSHENEGEPIVEIYDQNEAQREDKKEQSEFERQEDIIQEEQIMSIIEDHHKHDDINDSYTSLKKEDVSMDISPQNQQQLKHEQIDSGDGTHESRKQNYQEQNEHQIPTNSQQNYQQQKKLHAGYYSKKGQHVRNVPQQPYQKFRGTGSASIPAQQTYYQKRGSMNTGPGTYYSGRGSSNYNATYNVKRPIGWIKGSSNYYQEEEKQPYQPLQVASNLNTATGPKRIVTNSLKNVVAPQNPKYCRGRGISAQSYYSKNPDFEEEYQPHYTKKSRDDYDEDSYMDYNSGTNTYANNRFYAKKEYKSKYQYGDSERRREGEVHHEGQEDEDFENEEYGYQEEQRPSKDNSISSNKYVKEFASQRTHSQNEDEAPPKHDAAPLQKLSKNELEPFFESKNKEKQENKTFPSFNPQKNEEESKVRTPLYSKGEPHHTDSYGDNQNSSQKREQDFFDVFNQVNTVFQYGYYGRQSKDYTEEEDRQGQKQVFDYQENFGSESIQDLNQRETTEENEEDLGGSSLFTKALFGQHPMFGGSKISSNFGTANKQSVGAQDQQFSNRGNTGGSSGNSGPFSLMELRKESKPVSSQYSLFGNMAYRGNNQFDGGKQSKGLGIWSGKHFQEDDDEEESNEENGRTD